MRSRSSGCLLAPLFFLAMICLAASLISFARAGAEQPQPSSVTPVILSEEELLTVKENCHQLINQGITALAIKLEADRQKYDQFFMVAKNSLSFVDNNLQQIAHSANGLDLLTDAMRDLETDFNSAVNSYQDSLNRLLAMPDCTTSPGLFVAELRQAYDYRKTVAELAADIVGFIDTGLIAEMTKLKQELFE